MKLAATLKACSRGADGFADRVDGSGGGRYSSAAGRWGHLGFIDPEVRDLLAGYFLRDEAEPGGTVVVADLVPDRALMMPDGEVRWFDEELLELVALA